MGFDWTITLGNVLTLLGLIIGGFTVVWSMRTDVLLLGQRLTGVEKVLDKLAEVSTASAKLESRLNVLDERLNTFSTRIESVNRRLDAIPHQQYPPQPRRTAYNESE